MQSFSGCGTFHSRSLRKERQKLCKITTDSPDAHYEHAVPAGKVVILRSRAFNSGTRMGASEELLSTSEQAAEHPSQEPLPAAAESSAAPSLRLALPEETVAELRRLIEEHAIVEVEVLERIRGGLRVQYSTPDSTLPGFLPTSLATAKRYPMEQELRELVGQRFHVVIHELRPQEDGTVTIIFNRQRFLQDLALARLQEGQTVEGVITRLSTAGAFADVGGIEGFIPNAELDHRRIHSAQAVVKIGDRLPLKVLSIDLANRRVKLSRKALLPSPWEDAAQRYPVGSRVQGKVLRVTPRAAIVELEDGIEGLVPLSELSWTRRPLHPAELLHAGQEAEFVVLELEPERQRLVLSLRRTQPNPWEEAAARYPVGSRISVQVRRVTETAAIVETAEGIEGILPAAELSWARTRPAPAALLSPGQSLEVVVLELLPQQQRLVVSLRQALPNPWTEAPQRYPAGSRVQGTVLRLTPRAAIVEVEPGIEGIVPIGELSWTRRPTHPAELLSAGQSAEFVVLQVDAERRYLLLSLRQAQPNPWEQLAEQLAIGSEHEAVFVRMETAGAIVRLPGDVDAFMPRSSFRHLLRRTREPWKEGDVLRVRVESLVPEESSAIVLPADVAPANAAAPARTARRSPAPTPRPTPLAAKGTSEAPARSRSRAGSTLGELLPEEVRQRLLEQFKPS
jgi:small subunit ribosomal protein S1